VRVREHRIFARDGDDLHCEVPVTFTMAALGGELEIPTLGGQVKLKIPAETQTGRMFRLKGKGVKSVRSHKQGDLMCRIVLETPVKLSRRQKELLQEFENDYKGDDTEHNPRGESWLSSVREFFERMTS
jgi:molecular chaperone DnaJ